MRVLVTGGAGFVGAETVGVLRRRGHAVVATDRHGEADLLGDLAEPTFCSRLPDVDAVVHCAAVQYVSRDLPFGPREGYFERNNVSATRNLAARYSGGTTHFVNVGSSMMYRQTGRPIYDTRCVMGGEGVYSRSKVRALQRAQALAGPRTLVVPCIVAGSGREGLFRPFVATMMRWGVVIVPGAGTHKTHMVHVQDLATLLTLVVEQRATGVFNAAGPAPLSILEWVREVQSELGLRQVKHVHLPLSPLRVVSALTGYRVLAREQLLMLAQPHVLDITESLALGWKPQFDNATIVRQTARALAA